MSTRSKQDRQKSFQLGYFAEYIAVIFLMLKGYRILAHRFTSKLGEIDVIARQKDLVIFVEVKARRSSQSGVNAVTHSAQARIKAASDIWLAKQADYQSLSQRYDIITISPWKWPQHFIDAF